jgi:hypothetical protein
MVSSSSWFCKSIVLGHGLLGHWNITLLWSSACANNPINYYFCFLLLFLISIRCVSSSSFCNCEVLGHNLLSLVATCITMELFAYLINLGAYHSIVFYFLLQVFNILKYFYILCVVVFFLDVWVVGT